MNKQENKCQLIYISLYLARTFSTLHIRVLRPYVPPGAQKIGNSTYVYSSSFVCLSIKYQAYIGDPCAYF